MSNLYYKFIYINFLYFLVLSNNLNISYGNKELFTTLYEDIKVRPIYTGLINNNWLPFIDLENFNEAKLLSSKDIITFEFQDTRDNKIHKSGEYVFWNYKEIYADYINNLNSNLIYNSEW